jgi:tryptophan synthase
MGTTGSSDKVEMNKALPEIIERVRAYATVPIAVGFGVANRSHFETVQNAGADGVVIGSKLVTVIQNAPRGQVAQHVEAFCREISLAEESPRAASAIPQVTAASKKGPLPEALSPNSNTLPPRFGQFGGQYVPESLVDCLTELEEAHRNAMADPEFQAEFRSHFGYINRPSQLYLAERLTEDAGGARIWLKREDLWVLFCWLD